MDLIKTWYNPDDASSIEKLLGFVKHLPNNLEQFINPNTSNLDQLIERFKSQDLTYKRVINTFLHAKKMIDKNLLHINRWMKIEKITYNKSFYSKKLNMMHKAMFLSGLEGDSLDLKLGLLNRLWLSVVEFIDDAALTIIDFANNHLVKLIRKFFSYLNSLLGSIQSVFPFIEPMKEFKEILEGFFVIAEALK